MDLLQAVRTLKLNGTLEEEAEFSRLRDVMLGELKDEEQSVLDALARHDAGASVRHSILVAYDTVRIAREMRLPETEVAVLRVAALLHDVGKIKIHPEILNNVPSEELKGLWEWLHPGVRPPPNLLGAVTVKQLFAHRAAKLPFWKRHFRMALWRRWFAVHGVLESFERPLDSYLRLHQAATRQELVSRGIDERIVALAAAHHPSYFAPDERHGLPPLCRIIEVADKFNAIIQSEGVRAYTPRSSRLRAIEIIADELRREFTTRKDGDFQIEHRALGEIVEQYLPLEVTMTLLPSVESAIAYLREVRDTFKREVSPAERHRAEQVYLELSAALAVCLEFREAFDHIESLATVSAMERSQLQLESLLAHWRSRESLTSLVRERLRRAS